MRFAEITSSDCSERISNYHLMIRFMFPEIKLSMELKDDGPGMLTFFQAVALE